MKIVQTIEELREIRRQLPAPLGLVPTMGYLHEGHLSLVQAARRDCQSVAVSIYVNPAQFGPHEDFSAYPRDMDRDLDLLQKAGADLVWTPHDETMYPDGHQTWVVVEELSGSLEGKMRPGHFKGVATIVAKLFNCVQPERAYFGQKDAQQAVVLRKMVQDLNFPVEVVVCPTVREPDGLAKSSRNAYLNPNERQGAAVLYRALKKAEEAYAAGESNTTRIKQAMMAIFEQELLAKVQYISIAHPQTLAELDQLTGDALVSMAVYVGTTRLIDNLTLQKRNS